MEPTRDKVTGFCQFVRPGQVGMLVGEIRKSLQYTDFPGYTSEKETTKKVIRNISKEGDFAFVSGDLLRLDFYGNVYFTDRTGDTFRWKGENVSTTEVEAIAAKILNHRNCTVYGVAIPHTDGNAGMIAIECEPGTDIDLIELYDKMRDQLPEYSIPKFVRLTKKIATTTTHKLIKYQLKIDNFNPSNMHPVDDKLLYFDKITANYQILTNEVYKKIQNGEVKF